MDKMDRVTIACAAGGIAGALGCAIGNIWPAAGFIILVCGLGVVIWSCIKM